MRSILTIISIVISTTLWSQASTDFYYGNHFYTDNYYNQLNYLDNIDISKPYSTIGIGATEQLSKRLFQKIRFSFFIPRRIKIQDSIGFNTSGFAFDYDFAFDLIKKSSDKSKKTRFSLLMGLGFSTGQIYLIGNSLYQQKNPFFLPKVEFQPRYRIKKIILSITVDYGYDISNGKWKNTKFNSKSLAPINNLKQSQLTALFSIGYCL